MYKVLGADLHCPMFPLISSITQRQSAASFSKQPINQKTFHQSPIKNPRILLQQSFIYSDKQGGGATVLGEGCDIVTRETSVPTSLKVNNLGKAAVLAFCLCPVLQQGPC
jgi:hypothetical protein